MSRAARRRKRQSAEERPDGTQAKAVVTSTDPLTVLMEGADTECPAALLGGVSVSVSDRVVVAIRSPRRPIVFGTES